MIVKYSVFVVISQNLVGLVNPEMWLVYHGGSLLEDLVYTLDVARVQYSQIPVNVTRVNKLEKSYYIIISTEPEKTFDKI